MGDVLGGGAVGDSEKPVDVVDDPPVMPFDERAERRPIAVAGGEQHGCVISTVGHRQSHANKNTDRAKQRLKSHVH